jgi:hypothetical protein
MRRSIASRGSARAARESVAIVEDGARRSATGAATQPPSRTASNKPVKMGIAAPR